MLGALEVQLVWFHTRADGFLEGHVALKFWATRLQVGHQADKVGHDHEPLNFQVYTRMGYSSLNPEGPVLNPYLGFGMGPYLL